MRKFQAIVTVQIVGETSDPVRFGGNLCEAVVDGLLQGLRNSRVGIDIQNRLPSIVDMSYNVEREKA